MDIVLISDDDARILKQLADEQGITTDVLLARFIKKEDEGRHIVFVPGEGHIRVKCRYNCHETRERPRSYRD